MKRGALLYLAALLGCFAVGCIAAFCLSAYDALTEPAPLSGGTRVAFDGFTLRVPEGADVRDEAVPASGGARRAGSVTTNAGELFVYVYDNPQGDALETAPERDVVRYYTSAGCVDVRMRTLGGRPFVCYSARVEREGASELWRAFETWDADGRLVFETQMPPRDALPLLMTLEFDAGA